MEEEALPKRKAVSDDYRFSTKRLDLHNPHADLVLDPALSRDTFSPTSNDAIPGIQSETPKPTVFGDGLDSNMLTDSRETDSASTNPQHDSTSDAAPTVCYGMLPEVEVQLKWPPKDYQPNPQGSENGENYDRMKLELRSDHGLICTLEEKPVALVDNNSYKALCSCMAVQGFYAEIWVPVAEWGFKTSEALNLGIHSRKTVKMKIDMLLFGPENAGTSFATSLGECQLYLQDPHRSLIQAPYANPQSLEIPEVLLDGQNTNSTQFQASREEYDGERGEWDDERPDETAADPMSDIDALLDALPVHETTTTTLTDTRIISSLFKHQQEATDFMMRRETMTLQTTQDLWEHKSLDSVQAYYQHSITGAKSKYADDFYGGILADDMGLGKTLATLATIVFSSDRAKHFGARRVQNQPAGARSIEASKATLVVVPSELLLNTWAREIEKHLCPGSIRYIKYHGQERREFDSKLDQQDIILTTYGTVMAERRRGNSDLHRIEWYRLVLDEAHTIRNWSSKQFNAVHSISSHIRWCLTGTPIQNSLDDLGALVRFLKMPLFSQPAIFRRYVPKLRYRKGSTTGELENLRLILAAICLRRNKAVLPGQGYQIEDRKLTFTSQERDQYRNMELSLERAIDIGSKGHTDEKSHTKVMEALLRLRMFCNNGLDNSNLAKFLKRDPNEMLSFLQQSGEDICAFCSVDVLSIGNASDPDSGCLTPCCRAVCGECEQQYRGRDCDKPCPLCQAKHSLGIDPAGGHITVQPTETQHPSKIRGLIEDVDKHYLSNKCVIFSFYKSTLDIVGSALKARGIKYLRCDGDIPPKKRNTILLDFQNKSSWRVLIMTFSTGAFGLNGLTVASRVHLLEPQWNPAVEKQAMGRVLRLDQQNKVTVVRYAMKESIEEGNVCEKGSRTVAITA
ncbi:hypothetical protein FZEAL_6954 [Fusarium zealandicum]|uniref:Uncharacterized protein n=1 Tax=Fusarium zealandicum TaxID=1053134 RepID=A0A8H4XJ36_9HYPO|nr:hypothetical protein FZEAL_6954 [Fusarium zealandicum]